MNDQDKDERLELIRQSVERRKAQPVPEDSEDDLAFINNFNNWSGDNEAMY